PPHAGRRPAGGPGLVAGRAVAGLGLMGVGGRLLTGERGTRVLQVPRVLLVDRGAGELQERSLLLVSEPGVTRELQVPRVLLIERGAGVLQERSLLLVGEPGVAVGGRQEHLWIHYAH